jgi:hypothetical protein
MFMFDRPIEEPNAGSFLGAACFSDPFRPNQS